MLDDQDAGALGVYLLDQLDLALELGRVQAAAGLVQEQAAWAGGQGPGISRRLVRA